MHGMVALSVRKPYCPTSVFDDAYTVMEKSRTYAGLRDFRNLWAHHKYKFFQNLARFPYHFLSYRVKGPLEQ